MAVREDQVEMAEFLLREGADVNLVDKDQRSAQSNILSSISTVVNISEWDIIEFFFCFFFYL